MVGMQQQLCHLCLAPYTVVKYMYELCRHQEATAAVQTLLAVDGLVVQ